MKRGETHPVSRGISLEVEVMHRRKEGFTHEGTKRGRHEGNPWRGRGGGILGRVPCQLAWEMIGEGGDPGEKNRQKQEQTYRSPLKSICSSLKFIYQRVWPFGTSEQLLTFELPPAKKN